MKNIYMFFYLKNYFYIDIQSLVRLQNKTHHFHMEKMSKDGQNNQQPKRISVWITLII